MKIPKIKNTGLNEKRVVKHNADEQFLHDIHDFNEVILLNK